MFKKLSDLTSEDKESVLDIWQEAQEYNPEVPENVSGTMDQQEMRQTRDLRAQEIANSEALDGLVKATDNIANLARSMKNAATSDAAGGSDRLLMQIRFLQSIAYAVHEDIQPAVDYMFSQFTKEEIAAEKEDL